MAKNIDNVEIGDVDIYADGVNIGHTLGGAVFTFEHEFAELKVDEYASPIDYALTGENLMIKATLAEPTMLNISRAASGTEYESGANADRVHFGRKTGYLLSQDAVELVLHPRALATTDYSKDITIWKAITKESIELSYTVEDQRVLEVTYSAIPDETQPDGRLLGRVGPNLIS